MILTPKISALAIVLNEENNIRDYLNNMSFADEIIVVDSYSTDQTLHIIQNEYPHVKVFKQKFSDFSSQRNYAISLATNDWIVFFDADERISIKGIAEIKTVVNNIQKFDAFWVKRIFFYGNKPMHYGGKNQDKAIRLFRKSCSRYSNKLVHEQLIVRGKCGVLLERCQHYSFNNKKDFLQKRLQYSRLKALELFEKGKKPNFFHFFLKPSFRFFKHYVIELGMLNGRNGIDLSLIMAKHVKMRYVYLKEMYDIIKVDIDDNTNLKTINIGYEAKRVFHNGTGLGNYSRDLIRIMSAVYAQNNYYLYNPKLAEVDRFETNETNVFERLPSGSVSKFFYNLWRQFTIIKDLKNDKIEIFHGLSGELPFGLQQVKIKSVVTIHDLIFVRYPNFYSFFDRKIHLYKFKKAAESADRIIAISEQTKRDIVEFLHVPENKIVVVYQGCQDVFKVQYSLHEKKEVQNKFKLPEQFILNVGTIEVRKNVFAVVKAIQNTQTVLVIIGGDTPYKKEILNYVQHHNFSERVVFLKGLTSKELAIIYQLATIFVYPSLFEGFGIPIIEALYSKTPVITANSGVFPEAAGPSSIFVDPTDSDDIALKINLLLQNPELRHSIADKGFIFVQKFNNENIATNIMNVYENL